MSDAKEATVTRIGNYLRWWVDRPSRWVSNPQGLDDDHEADLFAADGQAHQAAVERGFLVRDPRPDCAGWQLSDAGLVFAREHMQRPTRQLDLGLDQFGGDE